MMKKIKEHRHIICLFLILLVATFLRLYKISSVPPSPSLDEVTIGYNAYSILKTGRDEYGSFLPLTLRAYDDWRPAFYVYTVIPITALFNLTVLAVRIPSVILSIFTIWLVYVLCLELFKNLKFKYSVAVISTFLLAISPWHIYLSRLGHEVNLGLFLIVLGVVLFLKYVNTKKSFGYLYASSVIFALSLNSYQSQKIITPFLVLSLIWIYKAKLITDKKHTILAFLSGILISLPIFFSLFTSSGLIRFSATSVFNNNPEIVNAEKNYSQAILDGNLIGRLLNSRYVIIPKIFLENYFYHFNPKWLFTGGGFESHKVPYTGLFYFWEWLLLTAGLIAVTGSKFSDKSLFNILVSWILISPLPAALTTQAPHAMRVFTMVIPMIIITATGILYIYTLFKAKIIRILYVSILISLYTYGNLLAVMNYFIVFPKTQSQSFQYALNMAITTIKRDSGSYKKVIVSNEDNLYQSYMFYLFYTRYDPVKYLKKGGTVSGGFAQTHQIDNIEFRPIDRKKDNQLQNTLFACNPDDFDAGTPIIDKFSYRDGSDGVWIAGTK